MVANIPQIVYCVDCVKIFFVRFSISNQQHSSHNSPDSKTNFLFLLLFVPHGARLTEMLAGKLAGHGKWANLLEHKNAEGQAKDVKVQQKTIKGHNETTRATSHTTRVSSQDSDSNSNEECNEKISIPNQIRQTFVDFTIAYFMEPVRPSPDKLDEFALKFFRLKAEKLKLMTATELEISQEDDEAGFIAFPSVMDIQMTEIPAIDPKNKYVLGKEVEDWITKFTIAFMTEIPPPSSIVVFGIQYCKSRNVHARGRDIAKML